ncbi:hypothetical protein BGZ60DRAFT_437730 [Tricladium varicosporioides]|nr:hypothetical protein BGZ60DRAFT_437730 [Hymenoscyphus varicosporioides]
MSTAAFTIFGYSFRNMLVGSFLVASLVSGEAVVNLLLGDSSIGESDIRFRGKVVGSIIGVDSTATTYDVACATSGPIIFPSTTPACVGGDHVTITQGPSTMVLTQAVVTAGNSQNFREGCTFSNTETVTCSLINVVGKVLVVSGQTTTALSTEISSRVNAPPTNPPLYFTVTITAGLEKVSAFQAAASPTSTVTGISSTPAISSSSATGSTSSDAEQFLLNGKWMLSLPLIATYFTS